MVLIFSGILESFCLRGFWSFLGIGIRQSVGKWRLGRQWLIIGDNTLKTLGVYLFSIMDKILTEQTNFLFVKVTIEASMVSKLTKSLKGKIFH